MSDYYYSYTGKTTHAELIEAARQDALASSLPRHPSHLARLWARLTRPAQPAPQPNPNPTLSAKPRGVVGTPWRA